MLHTCIHTYRRYSTQVKVTYTCAHPLPHLNSFAESLCTDLIFGAVLGVKNPNFWAGFLVRRSEWGGSGA